MSDIFITIITIMAVALLLFIFPLMSVTSQDEAITKMDVQALVSTFANTVSKEGKITEANYDEFIQKLYATGNAYSIEIEVQILDDTLSREGTEKYVIGESLYYSQFTTAIEKALTEEGEYKLKKGDYVKVKVENTNETFGRQLKRFLYGVIGKDATVIDVTSESILVGASADKGEIEEKIETEQEQKENTNPFHRISFSGDGPKIDIYSKVSLTYFFTIEPGNFEQIIASYKAWLFFKYKMETFPFTSHRYDVGSTVQITNDVPTIGNGYTFAGWTDDENRRYSEKPTVIYKPGDWITLNQDMSLYAVWKKNGEFSFVKAYEDENGNLYW